MAWASRWFLSGAAVVIEVRGRTAHHIPACQGSDLIVVAGIGKQGVSSGVPFHPLDQDKAPDPNSS